MNRASAATLSFTLSLLTASLALAQSKPLSTSRSRVDYATAAQVEAWLRDPVLGDPSFDAFERLQHNPLHRGTPPFEWPVNGFLFNDPASGNWYVYVGDYVEGYVARPSRCILYRSIDRGKTWQKMGVVLEGSAQAFDGEDGHPGHTPDVSVVYDNGRYHMVYDWATWHPGQVDLGADGGLAYAWAEKPEGPFHRDPEPIQRRSQQPQLAGRYTRPYAGTLLRRKNDWLVIGMMDAAPNSWAFYAMTAAKPGGPYTPAVLQRHVETDYYHPPLLEAFPAFAHDGFVYVPTTSVAANRNFNVIFRAPLERAHEPTAWEIFQHGSAWHSEPVENEYYGIWGQTFSGFIDKAGVFEVMFPSRDARGMGTINLARRPWNEPLRERGFVLTGHTAPSITFLRRAYHEFKLEATFTTTGQASLILDYKGALGPDRPASDASLHLLTQTALNTLEFAEGSWEIVQVDKGGPRKFMVAGRAPGVQPWKITVQRNADGKTRFAINSKLQWEGTLKRGNFSRVSGVLGLLVRPHSSMAVERFELEGQSQPAKFAWLYSHALLGAGENAAAWPLQQERFYRFGVGVISTKPKPRVKWNISGRGATLWSPRGPDFGEVEIIMDGHRATTLDLQAAQLTRSEPVWSGEFEPGFHAIVLQGIRGVMPVDSLETTD